MRKIKENYNLISRLLFFYRNFKISKLLAIFKLSCQNNSLQAYDYTSHLWIKYIRIFSKAIFNIHNLFKNLNLCIVYQFVKTITVIYESIGLVWFINNELSTLCVMKWFTTTQFFTMLLNVEYWQLHNIRPYINMY